MAHTITLSIAGMHCSACVGRIEQELQNVNGVTGVSVSLDDEQAVVELDTTDVYSKELVAAVDRAGYHAEIV